MNGSSKPATLSRWRLAVEKIKSTSAAHPMALGFLLSAGFLLLVLLLVPVRYETNDDISLIAELVHADAGEMGVVDFLSFTMQFFLVWLYDIAPSMPWYSLTLYGGLLLGMGLIMTVLVQRSLQAPLTLLLWPAVGALFLHMIVFLNFTAPTVLLVASSALVLLNVLADGNTRDRLGRGAAGMSVLAVVLAVLLRFQVGVRMLLLWLPLVLYLKKRKLVRALPWAAVLLILIGGELVFDHYNHQSASEMPKMRLFRDLRADFHDSIKGVDHGEQTDRALEEAGWTREDYRFFKHWILLDEELFSLDRLQTFIRVNDPKQSRDVTAFWKRFKSSYKRNKGYVDIFMWAFFLILVLGWEVFYNAQPKEKLKIVLGLLFCGACIFFFMFYRFKPRVYVPVFVYALSVAILLLTRPGMKEALRSKTLKMLWLAAVIVLATGTYWKIVQVENAVFRVLEQSKTQKQHIAGSIEHVKADRGTEILLFRMDPALGLGSEFIHPLKELDELPKVRLVPKYIDKKDPNLLAFHKECGLSGGRDFLKWAIDNPRLLYVLLAKGQSHERNNRLLWRSYFNRNIVKKGSVRFIPVYDFRNARGWGMVFYELRLS